jgi:hypothetical protein
MVVVDGCDGGVDDDGSGGDGGGGGRRKKNETGQDGTGTKTQKGKN